MSFDKEQLALLCANYDRRIDSLSAENKRLRAENAKLREQVRELWSMYYWYAPDPSELDEVKDNMRELGAEVDG